MFAKLYHQVVYSSLTQKEPVFVRGVFFMLMAIADRGGVVLGTDESIARIINVPIDEFNEALTALMKPDPDSQSKEHDGRRIIRLDGVPGLFLVNYVKYAEIGSDEQRREYFRTKKAESRARKKEVEEEGCHQHARTVLHYLNEATGRHFRETSENLGFISQRLREPGVELEGVKKMIDRQCALWKTDAKMAEFLRPQTLFNKTKFDSYYAANHKPADPQSELPYDPNDPKSILNWVRS